MLGIGLQAGLPTTDGGILFKGTVSGAGETVRPRKRCEI